MEFDPQNGNLLMLNQWISPLPMSNLESPPGTHRAPQQGSHPTNVPGPRQQQTLQRALGLSMPGIFAVAVAESKVRFDLG